VSARKGDAPVPAPPVALRLAGWLPASRANGPGVRAVLWLQGCTLGCEGCFNPEMRSPHGGELLSVDAVFGHILALGDAIEGISLSGGEPLQQLDALLALLRRVRQETSLSVLVFTGYTWDEVQAMPDATALLQCVDVLIAGRYVASQRVGLGMIGSANQTVHLLTERYTLDDVRSVPQAEVIITEKGELVVSGIDPLEMERGNST